MRPAPRRVINIGHWNSRVFGLTHANETTRAIGRPGPAYPCNNHGRKIDRDWSLKMIYFTYFFVTLGFIFLFITTARMIHDFLHWIDPK